jgi:nucleoside-diphosphate-sugar epimerase
MKVLVTGHHGYIGSIVAPHLARAGHEVAGVDTFFYRGCDLFSDEGAGVESICADIRDLGIDDLRGYDAVVHLAALSNDPLGDLDRELTYEINHRATVQIAEAARAAGVSRFVFASSCSMYGTSGEDSVTEVAPLRPLTAYAESKVRSEQDLSRLAGDSFSPVYLRCATAFGASPRQRVDVVVNNLVAWAFTTKQVRILSDGTAWRPLVHVRDIAHAVETVLAAPQETIHDEPFNIGADSENYTVREVAELVREAVPEAAVEFGGRNDPDPRSYRVDFGKVQVAVPAFRPRWTVGAGARELARAYAEAELTFEEFDGPRFTRLKQLQRLRSAGALDKDLRWRQGVAVRSPSVSD